jgi:hypothetical protein
MVTFSFYIVSFSIDGRTFRETAFTLYPTRSSAVHKYIVTDTKRELILNSSAVAFVV